MYNQECQLNWFQMRSDILCGLISIQVVCNRYFTINSHKNVPQAGKEFKLKLSFENSDDCVTKSVFSYGKFITQTVKQRRQTQVKYLILSKLYTGSKLFVNGTSIKLQHEKNSTFLQRKDSVQNCHGIFASLRSFFQGLNGPQFCMNRQTKTDVHICRPSEENKSVLAEIDQILRTIELKHQICHSSLGRAFVSLSDFGRTVTISISEQPFCSSNFVI